MSVRLPRRGSFPCRKASGAALLSLTLSLLCVGLGVSSCSDLPEVDAVEGLYERDVSGGLHSTGPMRGERGPLMYRDGDTEAACTFCHEEGFEGTLGEEALENTHANITFDHGRNVLCLNCHHPKNADAFVNFGGEEISGDQPTQLCAKCHGPHYNEYLVGIHGRINGGWKRDDPNAKRLDCIQCHDPHKPRFPQMTPQPPPVLTRPMDGGHPEGDLDHAE